MQTDVADTELDPNSVIKKYLLLEIDIIIKVL